MNNCQTSREHGQTNTDIEERKEEKYRRYYNRGAGDLFEKKWDLKRIPSKWNLSMSLTG